MSLDIRCHNCGAYDTMYLEDEKGNDSVEALPAFTDEQGCISVRVNGEWIDVEPRAALLTRESRTMGDATVESLLSQALGSLSFAMDNVERGIDGNALAHIKDAKRDIRAVLRSDSPDRGSVKSPTGVCSECGRILYRPASTGGERDAVPVDLQGSQPIGAGPHKGDYRRIPDSTEPNDG